jgi:phage nucleotide-binding protein
VKITSTENVHYKPSYICVYGAGGIGKTSLARTLPGHEVLILDAESGIASLAGTKMDAIALGKNDDGVMIPPEDRYARLLEFNKLIQTPEFKKKYKYLFIDSLTEIGQNVLEMSQKKFKGYEAWGNYTATMMQLLKFYRDIGHYTVIFTALEGRIEDEAGASSAYPDIGGKKAKEYLLPQFDCVLRMIVDSEKKRQLVTRTTPKTQAKCRSEKVNELEAPDLGALINKMRGEVAAQKVAAAPEGVKNV